MNLQTFFDSVEAFRKSRVQISSADRKELQQQMRAVAKFDLRTNAGRIQKSEIEVLLQKRIEYLHSREKTFPVRVQRKLEKWCSSSYLFAVFCRDRRGGKSPVRRSSFKKYLPQIPSSKSLPQHSVLNPETTLLQQCNHHSCTVVAPSSAVAALNYPTGTIRAASACNSSGAGTQEQPRVVTSSSSTANQCQRKQQQPRLDLLKTPHGEQTDDVNISRPATVDILGDSTGLSLHGLDSPGEIYGARPDENGLRPPNSITTTPCCESDPGRPMISASSPPGRIIADPTPSLGGSQTRDPGPDSSVTRVVVAHTTTTGTPLPRSTLSSCDPDDDRQEEGGERQEVVTLRWPVLDSGAAPGVSVANATGTQGPEGRVRSCSTSSVTLGTVAGKTSGFKFKSSTDAEQKKLLEDSWQDSPSAKPNSTLCYESTNAAPDESEALSQEFGQTKVLGSGAKQGNSTAGKDSGAASSKDVDVGKDAIVQVLRQALQHLAKRELDSQKETVATPNPCRGVLQTPSETTCIDSTLDYDLFLKNQCGELPTWRERHSILWNILTVLAFYLIAPIFYCTFDVEGGGVCSETYITIAVNQ